MEEYRTTTDQEDLYLTAITSFDKRDSGKPLLVLCFFMIIGSVILSTVFWNSDDASTMNTLALLGIFFGFCGVILSLRDRKMRDEDGTETIENRYVQRLIGIVGVEVQYKDRSIPSETIITVNKTRIFPPMQWIDLFKNGSMISLECVQIKSQMFVLSIRDLRSVDEEVPLGLLDIRNAGSPISSIFSMLSIIVSILLVFLFYSSGDFPFLWISVVLIVVGILLGKYDIHKYKSQKGLLRIRDYYENKISDD